MDRPKPGGVVAPPPTAPSRQPPLRRWKFARLISSSHPPSVRVLFASLAVGRLLDLGTLALPHRTVRGTLRRLSQYFSHVFPPKRRQYQKSLGQSGNLLPRHASTAQGRHGHNNEEVIRLTLLEGVPSRSHSTSDTHADSGSYMLAAECTQRRPGFSSSWSPHHTSSKKQTAVLCREQNRSSVDARARIRRCLPCPLLLIIAVVDNGVRPLLLRRRCCLGSRHLQLDSSHRLAA